MNTKARWIISMILIVGFTVGGGAALYWQSFVKAPWAAGQSQKVTVQLPAGSHFHALVRQLQWMGLVDRPVLWRIYGWLHSPQVKAGEYALDDDEHLTAFMLRVQQGEVVRHPFTIVEGTEVAQLRQALASEPKLVNLTAQWSDEALVQALACEGCTLEGQFLPETYLYERGDSDLAVLKRAHEAMKVTLNEAWETRDPQLPINNPQELLILASLIEKETALASERGEVAGVFMRRLQQNMRLQTDPTVIYGLRGTYNGRLTRSDLRTDHPWNTYTRAGLPASAIAMPSRASIVAASQPKAGTALYFVARGDGSHVFSDTLDEHNRAVNRYIRGQGQ